MANLEVILAVNTLVTKYSLQLSFAAQVSNDNKNETFCFEKPLNMIGKSVNEDYTSRTFLQFIYVSIACHTDTARRRHITLLVCGNQRSQLRPCAAADTLCKEFSCDSG